MRSDHFKLIPLLVFVLVGSLSSSGWVMCVRADGHVMLKPANRLNAKCCKHTCRFVLDPRMPSAGSDDETDFTCSKGKPCVVIPWALMVAGRAPEAGQSLSFGRALALCAWPSLPPWLAKNGVRLFRYIPCTGESCLPPEHLRFTILLI